MVELKERNPRKNIKRVLKPYQEKFNPHDTFSPNVKKCNANSPNTYSSFSMLDDKSKSYINDVCNKVIPKSVDDLDLSYSFRPNAATNYLLDNIDIMSRIEKLQLFNNCYEKVLFQDDIVFTIINDKDIANYLIDAIPNYSYTIQLRLGELINSPQFKYKDITSTIMSKMINKADMDKFICIGIPEHVAVELIKFEKMYQDINLAQIVLNYIMNNKSIMYKCNDIISVMFNKFKPVYIGMMLMTNIDNEIYNYILEIMEFSLTSKQIEKIFLSYYNYLVNNNLRQLRPCTTDRFIKLNNIKNEIIYKYGARLF